MLTQADENFDPKFVSKSNFKKFKRAFLATQSTKGKEEYAKSLADHIEFISFSPVFDSIKGTKFKEKIAARVKEKLINFDPDNDVLVCFGDQMIVAMAVMYLSTRVGRVNIARWSRLADNYVVREIALELFTND